MTSETKAFIKEVKHKWGESQLGCLGLPMSNEWKKAIKIIEEQAKEIERLKQELADVKKDFDDSYKRWVVAIENAEARHSYGRPRVNL